MFLSIIKYLTNPSFQKVLTSIPAYFFFSSSKVLSLSGLFNYGYYPNQRPYYGGIYPNGAGYPPYGSTGFGFGGGGYYPQNGFGTNILGGSGFGGYGLYLFAGILKKWIRNDIRLQVASEVTVVSTIHTLAIQIIIIREIEISVLATIGARMLMVFYQLQMWYRVIVTNTDIYNVYNSLLIVSFVLRFELYVRATVK